jgi:hypothetical protein
VARRPFSGTPADYFIDANGAPQPGRDGGGAIIASATVWTAQTGGTQVTDLQTAAGVAISGGVLVPDQTGRLAPFLGPTDGTAKLWLDAGAGRILMLATDDPDRLTIVEATGGTSVSSPPPATAVVYSAGFRASRPATNAGAFSWTCDGAADQTEINAAITAVAAEGGGKVVLLGSAFTISGAILLRTGVSLQGEGLGTVIRPSGNFQTGMVMLFDNTAHATHLSGMTLDGNGFEVHGIHYLANGGQVFTASPSTNPDPAHTIRDMNIMQCGSATFAGHGILLAGSNLRAGKYSDIRLLANTGCNVWVNGAVDSHFTNIEGGSAGSGGPAPATTSTAPVGVGFYMGAGDNCMVTACKMWFSRHAGFYVRGTRNGFTACQSQDNYGHGFQVAFGKNSFVNCHADSNGQGVDTRGRDGFNVTSDLNTLVGCMAYDRLQGDHTWVQQNGFSFTSGFANGRVVGCVTYQNAIASVSGAAAASTTVDVRGDAAGN